MRFFAPLPGANWAQSGAAVRRGEVPRRVKPLEFVTNGPRSAAAGSKVACRDRGLQKPVIRPLVQSPIVRCPLPPAPARACARAAASNGLLPVVRTRMNARPVVQQDLDRRHGVPRRRPVQARVPPDIAGVESAPRVTNAATMPAASCIPPHAGSVTTVGCTRGDVGAAAERHPHRSARRSQCWRGTGPEVWWPTVTELAAPPLGASRVPPWCRGPSTSPRPRPPPTSRWRPGGPSGAADLSALGWGNP